MNKKKVLVLFCLINIIILTNVKADTFLNVGFDNITIKIDNNGDVIGSKKFDDGNNTLKISDNERGNFEIEQKDLNDYSIICDNDFLTCGQEVFSLVPTNKSYVYTSEDLDSRSELYKGNNNIDHVDYYLLENTSYLVDDLVLGWNNVSSIVSVVDNSTGEITNTTVWNNYTTYVPSGEKLLKYKNTWKKLDDNKLSGESGDLIVAMVFYKKADVGEYSIKTVPSFIGYEEPKLTWQNNSFPIRFTADTFGSGVGIFNWTNGNENSNSTHFSFHYSCSQTNCTDIMMTQDNMTAANYWVVENATYNPDGTTKTWGRTYVNLTNTSATTLNFYMNSSSVTPHNNSGTGVFPFLRDFRNGCDISDWTVTGASGLFYCQNNLLKNNASSITTGSLSINMGLSDNYELVVNRNYDTLTSEGTKDMGVGTPQSNGAEGDFGNNTVFAVAPQIVRVYIQGKQNDTTWGFDTSFHEFHISKSGNTHVFDIKNDSEPNQNFYFYPYTFTAVSTISPNVILGSQAGGLNNANINYLYVINTSNRVSSLGVLGSVNTIPVYPPQPLYNTTVCGNFYCNISWSKNNSGQDGFNVTVNLTNVFYVTSTASLNYSLNLSLKPHDKFNVTIFAWNNTGYNSILSTVDNVSLPNNLPVISENGGMSSVSFTTSDTSIISIKNITDLDKDSLIVTVGVKLVGGNEVNYTLTTTDNITWSYIYSTLSTGTYNITNFYVNDSYNSTLRTSTIQFIVTSPVVGVSSGGGGGGGYVPQPTYTETPLQSILNLSILNYTDSARSISSINAISDCLTQSFYLSNACSGAIIVSMAEQVNWGSLLIGALFGTFLTLYLSSLLVKKKRALIWDALIYTTVTIILLLSANLVGFNFTYIFNYLMNSSLPVWLFLSSAVWAILLSIIFDSVIKPPTIYTMKKIST